MKTIILDSAADIILPDKAAYKKYFYNIFITKTLITQNKNS